VSFALLAISIGFFGLFPKYVAPAVAHGIMKESPNIFYFMELAESNTKVVMNVIDDTFPHSTLSKTYRRSGVAEIYALSVVAMRKMRMFELFMYCLFCFLFTMFWLFVTFVFR
jgi:hypothetical protein